MILLAGSAALIGFLHSLAPAHWLPIVLMSKTLRWNTRQKIGGALITSSAHVIVSIIVTSLIVFFGQELAPVMEAQLEKHSGLLIALFGAGYTILAYFRHAQCQGHSHHGPDPKKAIKRPGFFLFLVGLSPCVAVIPVLAGAAPKGLSALVFSAIFFSVGVVAALVGSTLLVSRGLVKLDHPLLEHWGEVFTGVLVFLVGVLLFFELS